MMVGLSRQEKEELIVELYNKGKTHREIAKEARVSLRDIRPILNKNGIEKSFSLSSQAYRLFSEGKTPVHVATALNIRQSEVSEFQKEYWKLIQLHILSQIYQEIGDNLYFFLELYKQAKSNGMNIQDVIKLLKISNSDISSVEYKYQQLKREEATLRVNNRNAARKLQQLSDVISDTQKTLDYYVVSCKQQRSEMDKLYLKKALLEGLVECFKSNNEVYVTLKETIKREVENSLTYLRQFLKFALVSLIESLRKDPNKFQLLYYQMSTDLKVSSQIPSVNGNQDYFISCEIEKDLTRGYNPTEDFEKFVLDEAAELYNKMIDELTTKTISTTSFQLSSFTL